MTTGGKSIKSKTGSAGITRQGHTTSGAFGSSVSKKRRYGTNVRDLKK
jgi:hypothetical protein